MRSRLLRRPLQDHLGAQRGLSRPFVTYPREGVNRLAQRLIRQAPLYDVYEETWNLPGEPHRWDTTLQIARTKSGDYIGMPDEAQYLCDRKGIAPQVVDPTHTVCSIGYSERDRKWYGWSHRALYGFRVGAVVSAGDVIAEYIPPGTRAHNLDEARWFAEAFARSVS